MCLCVLVCNSAIETNNLFKGAHVVSCCSLMNTLIFLPLQFSLLSCPAIDAVLCLSHALILHMYV